ncbi:MAG: FAD-dependent oxidoreductase, partial [Selenomonas sp.]|nr:FAD-dependent oxidoreductase [Selenomonas sp.]
MFFSEKSIQTVQPPKEVLLCNIPGFKKAYISREASMVGVRESWRIRGKYYMEADD